MNNPVKDPLDKLFASLNDAAHESPSAAFVQDLEARLDALEKKRRKPFFAWWIFSALGAVVLVSTYFFFVSNRAKSKVPNKPSSFARSTPFSASKSTSSNSNATFISSDKKNKPSNKEISPNSSTFQTTNSRIQKSIQTPTQLLIQAPAGSSSANKTSIEIINAQQDTYMINPILLSDALVIDSVSTVNQPMPVLPNEVTLTKKRVQHQFGLQFGVSAIFSSFEVPTVAPSLTSSELKLYRDSREFGERNTSSWDFNLRYGLNFGRFQLQTGLQYFEWGEQFQYAVISAEGTNRYKYISLPLLLGYSFEFGKVQVLPFAGIAMGKCFSSKGNYIDPQVNGVTLANSKKLAGAYIGQVELQYMLTPQLRFTCTPVYRRTMGPLIEEGLVTNRYQSVGLLTGFIYNF